MHGGTAQNYPQFDDEDKQEAARFLATDLDARPVIRGIDDEARLDAWTKVAKEIGAEGRQRRALRQRWQVLNEDDVSADEFQPASELESAGEVDEPAQEALADGGAEVVEEDATADEWQPRDGQDVLEYADDQDYQSDLRSARGLAEGYDAFDEVEDALEREQERDQWRPHVAQALTERLEVLEE